MKKKALILISLLSLTLNAQEINWNSIPWGSGTAKPPSTDKGRLWIIPAIAAPVAAATTALTLWFTRHKDESVEPCLLDEQLLLFEVIPSSGPGIPDGSFVAGLEQPGNGPYVFILKDRDTLSTAEPVYFGFGLEDGNYLLEVTDSIGCKGSLVIEIPSNGKKENVQTEMILSKKRPHFQFVFTPIFIIPPKKFSWRR
jgi:hypothetical protein